jgi:hypothetical protein
MGSPGGTANSLHDTLGDDVKRVRDTDAEVWDLALTLVVLDAVMSTRNRPLQPVDVERSLFSALENAIAAGEMKPASFLRFDPPRLFGQLQELRQRHFVQRVPEGYSVTAAGHNQAEQWRISLLPPATADRLREGVTAAA